MPREAPGMRAVPFENELLMIFSPDLNGSGMPSPFRRTWSKDRKCGSGLLSKRGLFYIDGLRLRRTLLRVTWASWRSLVEKGVWLKNSQIAATSMRESEFFRCSCGSDEACGTCFAIWCMLPIPHIYTHESSVRMR